MFNLLPPNEKRNILKEYTTRRYILIAMFSFALGVICVVSLVPSYLLSTAKIDEVNDDLARLKGSEAFRESDNLNKTLVETNAKLASLKTTKNEMYASDLISRVLVKRDLNIRISGLMYKKVESGGAITITGIAHDRENLSKFVGALRGRSQNAPNRALGVRRYPAWS